MRLTLAHLTKTYPNSVRALDDFSLDIGVGMFGLLGPNGAGKSTLMRTIATLQQPDSGEIWFDNFDVLKDPMRLRQQLGYLPQEFGVYPRQSAESLLDYFATLKGIASRKDRKKMIDEVLSITNLEDVRKKNVDGYSGGMKQRFGIAQLLLNKPALIIVDEPTAGLDPAERNRFLNMLREVGTSSIVIFSTHLVDDVKDLCQELAIVNGGRLLKHSSPANAIAEIKGLIWTAAIPRDLLQKTQTQHQVLSSHYTNESSIQIRIHAHVKPDDRFVPAIPTLEDVYFTALKSEVKP